MKDNIRNTSLSIMIILLSFTAVWLSKVILIFIGAWLIDIDGNIVFDKLSVYVNYDNWTFLQVLIIYLMPFLVLLFITFILGRKYHYPIKYSRVSVLFNSWIYSLLLLEVFLIPAIDILNNTGIYIPISWLGFTRIEQYMVAGLLFLLYLNGSSRLGPFFALATKLPTLDITDKRPVLNQIITLLVFPGIVLFMLMLVLYKFEFKNTMIVYIIGLTYSLGLSSWQIHRYDVIIK